MSAPSPQTSTDPSLVSTRELFTIGVLCFVNVVNYMDRFSIAGVLVEIQGYYVIGDDLGGLLQSGFIISYMLFSPMFGYLGDRFSRRLICVSCIAAWTFMTLAGSFASTYMGFFVYRTLVGIGEAGFSTIAPTVISDIVSKGKRSTVFGIFYCAIPIGSGLGYLVSAKISQHTGQWWWGLRATPLLGMVGAILLCFAVDPGRGDKEAALAGGKAVKTTAYKEDLVYLLKNASFVLSTLAFTCVSFVTGALAWWAPKLLYYGFKLIPDKPAVELGNVVFNFGVLVLLTGIFGVLLGTALSKLLRPHFPYVDPIICGVGVLLSAPFFIASFFTCELHQFGTFCFVFFGLIMLNGNWAIVADILSYVVIPTRRASGAALQMLICHAFGDCCSPYITGVLSEHFKNQSSTSSAVADLDINVYKALRLSLLLIVLVEILGGIFFLGNACFIVRDEKLATQMGIIL